MSGPVVIHSIDEVFAHPRVRDSRVLEVCVCDAIHFRFTTPRPVFDLVEMRLCKRNADLYSGFADLREAVEESNRGATIQEKIDHCCVKNSAWLPERQVLYSVELEVWMDIAYPNSWALELYHSALKLGKWMYIPKQGPFTDLFHKLLLQKSGFERLAQSYEDSESIRVFIGPQVSLPEDSLHLVPKVESAKPHAISAGESLAAKSVNGALIRDNELQAYRNRETDQRLVHETAYRLIGPTLLLLLQSLKEYSRPVAFTGMGSGFLTTLCERLRHYWPWVPEMTNSESAKIRISLFPEKGTSKSLFPDLENESPSVLGPDEFDPAHLLLPPVNGFLKAFLKGTEAARMQASAAAFLTQYAQITRGLHLPIEAEPVLREWRRAVLSPDKVFLQKFSQRGCLPDYKRSLFPGRNMRSIKEGPWPTASFLTSSALLRVYLRMCAPKRVASICQAYRKNQG